jgi:hypothetical protein
MISTEQQLQTLTAEVLRDLGRNEAAGWAVRKAAVKMLIERGHAFANHPDFRELRLEIKEESEAHAEVESLIGQVEEVAEDLHAVDAPKFHSLPNSLEEFGKKLDEPEADKEYSGPLKASFTTKNQ